MTHHFLYLLFGRQLPDTALFVLACTCLFGRQLFDKAYLVVDCLIVNPTLLVLACLIANSSHFGVVSIKVRRDSAQKSSIHLYCGKLVVD